MDFKIKIKKCDIWTFAMIRELQNAMQHDAIIIVNTKWMIFYIVFD